ncbi:hypothetical protein WH43_00015 [Rheinheimera sp. KL1]|nr:hypothetical protein WH43_00015 [Rheinheimera sp. KL1]
MAQADKVKVEHLFGAGNKKPRRHRVTGEGEALNSTQTTNRPASPKQNWTDTPTKLQLLLTTGD